MATHDIIVIGASAGGVDALKQLVSQLPAGLPAAVFVTIHVLPHNQSYLPAILERAGPLPVMHAEDRSPIESGRIYVAPPNRHLLIELDHIHLSGGPRENRHRPAINPMFRSAALTYGPRVIGIILTGNLDDGTAGLWEVKRRGGIAVVEDPNTASYPEMPQSALANVDTDFVVGLDELPALLTSLVNQAPVGATGVSDVMQSKLTRFTCPDCHGPIERREMGQFPEFHCRVGHTFAPASMVAAQADSLERLLWRAVMSLEEGADLVSELSGHLGGDPARHNGEIKMKREVAARLREMIAQLNAETDMPDDNQ